MDDRTSSDLEIWKPASDFDRGELQPAAEKSGLLFDPKQTLEPKDVARIRKVIAEFSNPARERATENLVYLDVLET